MRAGPIVTIGMAIVVLGCTSQTGEPSMSSSATSSPSLVSTASTAADATNVPTPSATPTATPTATATAVPSPSPSLPVHPVLVSTVSGPNGKDYEIAVAPLPAPMDETVARARAAEIGALVGLGRPRDVYQPLEYPDEWRASWNSTIQGYAVDPAYDAIVLLMRADGTVLSFTTTTGPRLPLPKTILSRTQALRIAGTKSADTMQLVWAFRPSGSDSLRLAWYMSWKNQQADGEAWPCVLYLDAGTGKELFSGCVM